jgi:hypothetical protein
MKRSLTLLLVAAALSAPALSRNTMYKLPLAEVLESPDAMGRLDASVKFYFGNKTMPAGAEQKGFQVISRVAKASKWRNNDYASQNYGGGPPPPNAIRASSEPNDDIAACRAAALDALVAMQEEAKQLGANAVVDIVSFYNAATFSSATEYECHAGGTGGHLTFKATFAALPRS